MIVAYVFATQCFGGTGRVPQQRQLRNSTNQFEGGTNMNKLYRLFALIALALSTSLAVAAEADAPKATVKYVDPNPWEHKTKRLDRATLDKLLGHPEKILFIDVRRPDELTKLGGFPIYLSVQNKTLEESLDYIPKDRLIVTISNRAHRAGVAGDILIDKGFKVAGAVGVLDYQDEGGSLTKIAAPAPKPAAVAVAATITAAPVTEKK
jgi:rhodanese-related sulfurtransferase